MTGGLPVDPETVIEIRDPAIDVPAILAEIRAGLASRGYADADYSPELPAFTPDGFPGASWVAGLDVDPELAFLLEQAGDDHDRLTLAMDARPPAVPVGGATLLRAKQAVHEVILFYVNQLAGRQARVNGTLLRALGRLAADTAAVRRENRAIRAELGALKAQLAQSDAPKRTRKPPPAEKPREAR